MSGKRSPAAPAGLKAAGKKLWKEILADVPAGYELDARELHSLARACRCDDELLLLDRAVDRDGPVVVGSRGQPVVHPAISEARQLRLAQLRLLQTLTLDVPSEEAPGVRQARRAATARWSHRRNVQALRAAS